MSCVFGIILAAGAGRRMGGPKAGLVVAGRSLLEHHAARLRGVTDHVLAVVRARQDAIAVAQIEVHTLDPAGSLALAVQALDRTHPARDTDVVVITPVDMMPPASSTLSRLIAAASGASAVTPRHDGASGHPIVVRRPVLDVYRTSAPRLRDVLSGVHRLRLDVEDPCVLGDFDTPADLPRAV